MNITRKLLSIPFLFSLGIAISAILTIGVGLVLASVFTYPLGSILRLPFTWVEPTFIFIFLLLLDFLFYFLARRYTRQIELLEGAEGRAKMMEQRWQEAESRTRVIEQQQQEVENRARVMEQHWQEAENRAKVIEQQQQEVENRARVMEQHWQEAENQAKLRPILRIYPEGVGITDYELIEHVLFSVYNDLEFTVYPLQGGFSGTLVFRVNPKNSFPAVLKLGPRDKIVDEAKKYRQFVQNKLRTISLKEKKEDNSRGLLLYEYGSMTLRDSVTFEQFFLNNKQNIEEVQSVIQYLFEDSLRLWLEQPTSQPQFLYQDYRLDDQEWLLIENAIIDLDLDPYTEHFNTIGIRNPLIEIKEFFNRRRGKRFDTRQTTVHGDLNARNILIDSKNNIFVIDFAKTRKDCLLRDFCKLETEITYCLTRLPNNNALMRAVEIEKSLLLDGYEKPFITLGSLFSSGLDLPKSDQFARMVRSIREVRHQAGQAMRNDKGLAEQYYLILLYHTLDVLRYRQCDRWSKLFALHSLVSLCDALRQEDTQYRERSL